MNTKWRRANKQNRCGICNRDNWCMYAEDAMLCMRVTSDRVVQFKTGEVGYIHMRDAGPVVITEKPAVKININASNLMKLWRAVTPMWRIEALAKTLGVSVASLLAMGCTWAGPHTAYAFPMYDGYSNTIGVRLRSMTAAKWAVPGSSSGIFIPNTPPCDTAVVTEGPTDAAAVMELGLWPIGRPSCNGGSSHIIDIVRRLGIKNIAITADNDSPGLVGAKALADELPTRTCIMVLPTKDVRKFINDGGDAATFNAMLKVQLWSQPKSQRMEAVA